MTHSTNPVAIAKETVAIAKESGSPTFEKAAKWSLIASAAVTAVVGLLHAAHTIARDFTKKPEHHRDEARVSAKPVTASTVDIADTRPEPAQSWVQKSKSPERHSHPRTARHADHAGHFAGGRH